MNCRKLIKNDDARPGLAGSIFDTHFCEKEATWRACDGRDLCDEHAEEFVRLLQSPNTLMSILGGGALTEEQARSRIRRIQ